MSTPIPESIALFYTEGSSDKEYRVELRQVEGGLWMTLGFNGRRGQTLREQKKTQVPVEYAVAKAEYDKVVKKKKSDGYTTDISGAIYQSLPGDAQFSGVVPQLLNSVRDEASLASLIHDGDVVAQEKHDGERRLVRWADGKADGINKEGLMVGLPMSLVDTVAGMGVSRLLLDGEVMGERYVAFDLLEIDGQDLRAKPYEMRLKALEDLVDGKALGAMEVVQTARTPWEKRSLINSLQDHGAEGIVFKKASAHYAPGRPASGGTQMKYKFTEDCSVRVAARNTKKRSVSVECLGEDGESVALGNVTIPSNHDVPEVGDIVTVEYLYLFENGSLFQPVYRGARKDQAEPDRLHQFKLKAKGIFRGMFGEEAGKVAQKPKIGA